MKNRILVVNVNWIGDVLFSTPTLRALRKKYPDSFISCLVPKRCEALLKNNPYLNEVIIYDERIAFFSWWKAVSLVQQLKRRHFDQAIFFHPSKTKVFLARLAGIKERIGYASPLKKRSLTVAIPPPSQPLHKVDTFLNLLQGFDVPSDGRVMDFFVDKESEAGIRALLQDAGISASTPYLVIHPGGNWDLKRWPIPYFVETIKLFLQAFPWKVVICGTPPEESLAVQIKKHFKNEEVVSLCGKTSLGGLAALLKNAEFLLSNDSGPIHLAASQGTKIVGVYGPTLPALTGPISRGDSVILHKDVGCEVPCYFRSCDTRVCMDWLTPQEVFEKTMELLNQSSRV